MVRHGVRPPPVLFGPGAGAGRGRDKIAAALREVATPPGTVIRPGEWEKAKAALAAGEDINYEGASGNVDFDENGDVGGIYSVNTVSDTGDWDTKLIQ